MPKQEHRSMSFGRRILIKLLVLSAMISLAALITSRRGNAQSLVAGSAPDSSIDVGAQPGGLSALALDPQAPGDPYARFRQWRHDNRVTIAVPASVIRPH